MGDGRKTKSINPIHIITFALAIVFTAESVLWAAPVNLSRLVGGKGWLRAVREAERTDTASAPSSEQRTLPWSAAAEEIIGQQFFADAASEQMQARWPGLSLETIEKIRNLPRLPGGLSGDSGGLAGQAGAEVEDIQWTLGESTAIDGYDWQGATDEDYELVWMGPEGMEVFLLWPSQVINLAYRRYRDATAQLRSNLALLPGHTTDVRAIKNIKRALQELYKQFQEEVDLALSDRRVLAEKGRKRATIKLCNRGGRGKKFIRQELDKIAERDPYCIGLLKRKVNLSRFYWQLRKWEEGREELLPAYAWIDYGDDDNIFLTPTTTMSGATPLAHEAGHLRFAQLSPDAKRDFVHLLNAGLKRYSWSKAHSFLRARDYYVYAERHGIRLHGGDYRDERITAELFALFYEGWVRGGAAGDFSNVLLLAPMPSAERYIRKNRAARTEEIYDGALRTHLAEWLDMAEKAPPRTERSADLPEDQSYAAETSVVVGLLAEAVGEEIFSRNQAKVRYVDVAGRVNRYFSGSPTDEREFIWKKFFEEVNATAERNRAALLQQESAKIKDWFDRNIGTEGRPWLATKTLVTEAEGPLTYPQGPFPKGHYHSLGTVLLPKPDLSPAGAPAGGAGSAGETEGVAAQAARPRQGGTAEASP